jgi:hypothetical protein
MTNTSQHLDSAFPRFDRVVNNQRRLQLWTSLVTFAVFLAGAFVAASTLSA